MTAALQLPATQGPKALELLAERSRRLANVVEAISRRRDVRERRAQLLLLLLELRCPPSKSPRKSWYVPGAVARLGPAGIWRAWRGRFASDPPSERTIRKHLGELERHALIVRSPGDWIPVLFDDEHPERRPRHADTIHVLEREEDAEWWATTGRGLLRQNPAARHSPARWRAVFGDWRKRPREEQAGLPFPEVPALFDLHASKDGEEVGPRAAARELAQAAAASPSVLALLHSLDRVGARLAGVNRTRMARDPWRLKGASALLAIALRRQAGGELRNRVRNRAAWLVRAFKRATEAELFAALDWAVAASVQEPQNARDRTDGHQRPHAAPARE